MSKVRVRLSEFWVGDRPSQNTYQAEIVSERRNRTIDAMKKYNKGT